MKNFAVRQATIQDLDSLKRLADAHKNELGFVLRPALALDIERSQVWIAENSSGIVGFVEYHHRRDQQTTLYHIVVQPDHRQQGIGRRLIETLQREAANHGKTLIQLKCPVELPANGFYESLGFTKAAVLPGKDRELNVWQLKVVQD